MKQIIAYIKPFMLSKVQEALMQTHGFHGMTVMDCRGMGRARLDLQPHDRAPGVEFVAKVKIDLLVADEAADRIADVVARAAHTGNPGDGIVYVMPVDAAIRIKTFDRDERAL